MMLLFLVNCPLFVLEATLICLPGGSSTILLFLGSPFLLVYKLSFSSKLQQGQCNISRKITLKAQYPRAFKIALIFIYKSNTVNCREFCIQKKRQ